MRIVFLLICALLSASVGATLQADRIAILEGGLDQPSDAAISENGHVYVLDGVNNRIVVFNEKAKQVFNFGQSAGLNLPMGIAITDSKVKTYFFKEKLNILIQCSSSNYDFFKITSKYFSKFLFYFRINCFINKWDT